MASSNDKLDSILRELRLLYVLAEADLEAKGFKVEANEPLRTNRRNVRFAVIRALNITDTHTINKWIDKLLSFGFISPNPHTELSSRMHKIKPDNDTKYFINIEDVERKLKPHTHTPKLDSFNLSG